MDTKRSNLNTSFFLISLHETTSYHFMKQVHRCKNQCFEEKNLKGLRDKVRSS